MLAERSVARPQIFADTANPREIKDFQDLGLLSGITTNSVIIAKLGEKDIVGHLKRLSDSFAGIPLSVQLTPGSKTEMIDTAHLYAEVSPHVVIKVIMDRVQDWEVYVALAHEGRKINVTGLMSARQACFATLVLDKDGKPFDPMFVSLFFNRMKDALKEDQFDPKVHGSGDPLQEIRQTRAFLDRMQAETKIIVGSIRSAEDVEAAINAGAHIVTVPPQNVSPYDLVKYFIDHFKTREFAEHSLQAARNKF